MKKTLLILSSSLPIVLGMTCQKTAYQSIAATEAAVSAANAVYLDQVVSGKVPTNSVPTVEAAFNDTQLSLHAAALIASQGVAGPVPPAVAAKATAFTNAVITSGGKL